MTIFQTFHAVVASVVEEAVRLKGLAVEGAIPSFTLEPPRDTSHGDLATNVAMILAKKLGQPPRMVAELLKPLLEKHKDIAAVDVAGPGFINMRLQPTVWLSELKEILDAGLGYGNSALGEGIKINVEYVSANPTGPMHIGHARGAVVGDVLCSLLTKAGYDVCREYYINDAGAQVDVLARSTFLRYREALGEIIGEIPTGLYPGEYLIPVGQALAAEDGRKWLDKEEREWLPHFRLISVEAMMKLIRIDLAALGVRHDVFTSEKALVDRGGVERAYQFLHEQGLIYQGILEPPKGKQPEDWEPRPQSLFRATQFGDDVDRPLKKSDGSWTYFASDIACHFDKFSRGYSQMVDIFGADHGGYVKRMQAAVTAITGGQGRLEVRLCQMVNLMKNGEPYKMSKRAGTFVTLRDLVDEVGADVVRFIMLTRKSDAQLDFDLVKALEQTRDNPVFYVQYAHARCCSILRHAREFFSATELMSEELARADVGFLRSSDELQLIKFMASWSRVVVAAAQTSEPHRIAFYLMDLAAQFHGLWNKGNDDASLRFIVPGDKNLTRARLVLIKSVQTVLQSGLAVMGCKPLEELRNDVSAPAA